MSRGRSIVRWVPCPASVLVYIIPDGLRSQGLGHVQLCEQGFRHAPCSDKITRRVFSPTFLGLWLPCPFLFFTIDRAPYVSPSLPHHMNLPNWVLIELTSIAIWNKNRVVIALATCVWGIYLAFFIEGESSLHSGRRTEAAYRYRSLSGVSQVKNQSLEFVATCPHLCTAPL
jgi:hypothetical protein